MHTLQELEHAELDEFFMNMNMLNFCVVHMPEVCHLFLLPQLEATSKRAEILYTDSNVWHQACNFAWPSLEEKLLI